MHVFDVVELIGGVLAAGSVYNVVSGYYRNNNLIGKLGALLVGLAAGDSVMKFISRMKKAVDDTTAEVEAEQGDENQPEGTTAEEEEHYILIDGVKYYKKEESDERDDGAGET